LAEYVKIKADLRKNCSSRFMESAKKKIRSQGGFSLMEMVVSVFIIALMSGIFLANYRFGSSGTALKNTAEKMASDIRLAQNYCLGARDFNGSSASGGWGVYVSKGTNTYIIFADQNQSGDRQTSEDYRAVSLPSDIEISNIAGVSAVATTIIFYPPDPETRIDGAAAQVEITLRDKKTAQTYGILVNKMGLIEAR